MNISESDSEQSDGVCYRDHCLNEQGFLPQIVDCSFNFADLVIYDVCDSVHFTGGDMFEGEQLEKRMQ